MDFHDHGSGTRRDVVTAFVQFRAGFELKDGEGGKDPTMWENSEKT